LTHSGLAGSDVEGLGAGLFEPVNDLAGDELTTHRRRPERITAGDPWAANSPASTPLTVRAVIE